MDTEEEFVKTEYYRAWKGFLNDKEFRNMIHANDLKVIFYPHRCMQRFLSFFKPDDPSIIMADPEKYDVQELLKESAILITDYSSVAMDFAYMKKPLIYYQFDKETFVNEQYGSGYFSYERDGFGPVEYEIGGLKQALRNYIENGFNMEEKYRGRRDDFFELNDCNNCERNYQAVLKM
jgi:CDP-glycerol glycerophosphotransferase (TagB/SpsB family)